MDSESRVKVTLKSYNTPATKRVTESVERFQLDGHKILLAKQYYNEEASCDVIIIEGPKQSVIKLTRYIEALEKIARDWTIPTISE